MSAMKRRVHSFCLILAVAGTTLATPSLADSVPFWGRNLAKKTGVRRRRPSASPCASGLPGVQALRNVRAIGKLQ